MREFKLTLIEWSITKDHAWYFDLVNIDDYNRLGSRSLLFIQFGRLPLRLDLFFFKIK